MKFEGTKNLPSLEFDEAIGHLKIWGGSISFESKDFWDPLIDKMKTYLEDPRDISLTFALDYFNTISAKRILDLLRLVDKRAGETDRKFVVTWIYDDDEDMKEAGEDFESIVNKNTTWRYKINDESND